MATLVKIIEHGREEFKDGGSRVVAIKYDKNGIFESATPTDKPIIGCSLLVGSMTARTYSNQDYWLTTEVTEIVQETENYVIFKTLNSVYKLIK